MQDQTLVIQEDSARGVLITHLDRLFGFSGVIIGNSAGAIVLSKGGWGYGKFYPGFGLVDFHVTVHYKLGAGQVAKADTTINVNIPENMWITVASEK